jgi:hypothetical protein
MTLAAILLGIVFPLQGFLLQSTAVYAQIQATPASKPADSTQIQVQSASQPQNPPPSQAPSTSTTASPPAKPIRSLRHKKKVVQPDCNATTKPGTTSSAANTAPSGKSATQSAAGGSSPTSAKGSTPSNCPPTKVVVRQGGTSEPAIQLAGDASGSPLPSTNACHDAAQCLQSAEENLKKISAQQLDSNKQEMVGQVRQFMDQSKAATKAGDLDRARTLAWKAQTLSEELVTPQK